MNAWINEIAEATGIGHAALDFSLSDMGSLVPDVRILWVAAAALAFIVLARCQELWFNGRQDRESDPHRK